MSTVDVEQGPDGWHITDGQGYKAGPFRTEQEARDDQFYWGD